MTAYRHAPWALALFLTGTALLAVTAGTWVGAIPGVPLVLAGLWLFLRDFCNDDEIWRHFS